VIIFLSSASSIQSVRAAAPDHGFSVKEYENFHDVLHPLEHEALPKNDFKTIRARASELVRLGGAIVVLGVPRGVDEKYVAEFKEWLGKFHLALGKFKRDAEAGTDEELRESYSAVHDSFEMLAAMLPRK
jgi:hypothetical protein